MNQNHFNKPSIEKNRLFISQTSNERRKTGSKTKAEHTYPSMCFFLSSSSRCFVHFQSRYCLWIPMTDVSAPQHRTHERNNNRGKDRFCYWEQFCSVFAFSFSSCSCSVLGPYRCTLTQCVCPIKCIFDSFGSELLLVVAAAGNRTWQRSIEFAELLVVSSTAGRIEQQAKMKLRGHCAIHIYVWRKNTCLLLFAMRWMAFRDAPTRCHIVNVLRMRFVFNLSVQWNKN